jgi:hypothetical protein
VTGVRIATTADERGAQLRAATEAGAAATGSLRRSRALRPSLFALLLAACGPRPQPIVYLPTEPAPPGEVSVPTTETPTATEPASTETTPKPAEPAPRSPWPDYQVPTLPMDLVLHRGTLVWADLAGAIWTMPADGSGAPEQVSEQHRDGFAAHPFVAGDRVIARGGKGLLEIVVPGGAVTHVRVTGAPDQLEDVVGDASTIFFTVFNHDQIMRVPVTGGAAQHVFNAKNAVLALHGPTLYVASYNTGDLFAVPIDGGVPRTIANKLKHPTALAVDDTAAYVYTKGDQRLTRVELVTGATKVLGEHLDNSDEVVLAADALYTVSWPNKLVRLAKVPGAAPATLTDKLFQPRGVVRDEHFIYVTSDQPPRIVRVPAR